MKNFILFLLFTNILFSENRLDTVQVSYDSKTLYYQWEIIDGLPLVSRLDYNGSVFLSYLSNGLTKNSAYSYDFLKTWDTIPWFRLEDDIYLIDYCLLPNNNIVMSGYYREYLPNGPVSGRAIMILEEKSKEWTTYMKEEFIDIPIGSIVFKDSLNGLIAGGKNGETLEQLYKSIDGGKSWNLYKNMEEFVKFEKFNISTLKLLDDNILLALIYNFENKQYYFSFSKDFGETWTETRTLPKESKNYTPHHTWGYCNRKDSIWFAGSSKNGFGDSFYELIYFSPDLGLTWKAQYLGLSPVLTSKFTSVEFFDNSLVGLAAERSARVLITFDGGNNWTWIRDSVCAYGELSGNDYFDPDKLGKHKVIKADNKMIFTGNNKVFIFHNLNLPNSTGVDDEDETELQVYYGIKEKNIHINSKSDKMIQSVKLYDVTGKNLYSGSGYNSQSCAIPKSELGSTKNVFAIIQAGGKMYFKQLLCE